LPSREAAPMPGARRQPSFNNAEPGPERDWSAARGSRFTPSAPGAGAGGAGGFRNDAPRGDRFESRGDRFAAPLEPSQADEVDQWRSSKPMVEPRSTSQRGFQREGPVASGQSSPGLADTEQTVRRALSTDQCANTWL
jgi:translation initiation factor 4B